VTVSLPRVRRKEAGGAEDKLIVLGAWPALWGVRSIAAAMRHDKDPRPCVPGASYFTWLMWDLSALFFPQILFFWLKLQWEAILG